MAYQHGYKTTEGEAPASVADVYSSTIVLVGTAPKGPAQILTRVSNPTEAAIFGSKLTGFTIPPALEQIFAETNTPVYVINVFDATSMTSTITNESVTITQLKGKLAYNPIGAITVQSSDLSTTYVSGVDYKSDDYGNITFITPIATGSTVKVTYKKFTNGAETLSSASVTVSSTGNAGDKIDMQIIAGANTIDIGTYSIPANPTNSSVAAGMAAFINARTYLNQYTATANGAVLTITAPIGTGATPNSYVFKSIGKSSMTFSGASVDAIAALSSVSSTTATDLIDVILSDAQNNITDLGTTTVASGQTSTQVATAIAATINSGTSTHHCTASSNGTAFSVTAPSGLGNVGNGYSISLGLASQKQLSGGSGGVGASASITILGMMPIGSGFIAQINTGSGSVVIGNTTIQSAAAQNNATNIRAAINAGTGTHGYTASGTGAVVTVTAPSATGTAGNSYTLIITGICTGAFNTTTTQFSGGANIYAQDTLSNAGNAGDTLTASVITGSGTVVIANTTVPANPTTTSVATALAAAVNSGTSTHHFTATSSGAVLKVYVPDGANGSSYVMIINGLTSTVLSSYMTNFAGGINATINAGTIIGGQTNGTRTGLALCDLMQAQYNVKPKLVVIPVYNYLNAVQTAMQAVETKYRATGLYSWPCNTTVSAAIADRGVNGVYNEADYDGILQLGWRSYYHSDLNTTVLYDPTPALAGLIAKIDNQLFKETEGYWTSPSSHLYAGGTAYTRADGTKGVTELNISWDPEDPTTEANQLNAVGICCTVSGYGKPQLQWGNRNMAFNANTDPQTFISRRRTHQMLKEVLAKTIIANYLDDIMNPAQISYVVSVGNEAVRNLVDKKVLVPGSKVTFDPTQNNLTDMGNGIYKFSLNEMGYLPAELIVMITTEDKTLLNNLLQNNI
jgi:phage tail sheath protein FI